MKQQLKNIIKLAIHIFDYDHRVEGIKINYTKSSGVHEGGAIPVDNAGKYLDLGLSFTDEISFFRNINDALSVFFSDKNIFNQDNTFQLIINKDLTYSFKHFFDSSLDSVREAETREAIGDELYEKLEEERRNFKESEEKTINMHDEEMSTGQLLGYIKDELSDDLPKNWKSLILETKITKEGDQKLIDTTFYYQSLDENKVKFEPNNPIPSMNALMQIRDKMSEEGNIWNASTITITETGDVDIQLQS